MAELDLHRATIEPTYARFLADLPDALQGVARHLPLRIGLSARAGIAWVDAIEEPLILALPTEILGAVEPDAHTELVAAAQRVHLFAMLSALVLAQADRGAVELDAELDELLAQFERQRHRAVAELRLLGAERGSSFSAAEREARSAAAQELAVFEGEDRVEIATCVAIHSNKRGLAFPATLAAAQAAGIEIDRLAHIHDFILGALLGIAFRREIEEAEERARVRRSWVSALARERGQPAALGELLHLAIDAFERATIAARALGAAELQAWAAARAERVGELARAEVAAGRARMPGGSASAA